MERPTLELADIFRTHGAAYRQTHALPRSQLRLMRAIEVCRTAALGGHVRKCGHCSHPQIAYNSCRNRHCPKCQGRDRAQWVAKRTDDLLPVEYFHVVFTIPEPLAALALRNKGVVYGILFRTAAETLLTIARDRKHLGAEIGFFAVLHTWGQNLLHHPHVHCVVPGGGIAVGEDRWVSCLPGFFLPVRVLSRLFRRLFIEALQAAYAKGELEFHGELQTLGEESSFQALLDRVRQSEWVVYAKPPFGGPRQVLEYLGRYSHRVAISNERLLAQTESTVTFRWKDYRHPQRKKTMTLAGEEFMRRFLLHTLPDGFPRIRHYGWLSNRARRQKLALCRSLLDNPITALLPRLTEEFRSWSEALLAEKDWRCPRCGIGVLEIIEVIAPQRYVPEGIDSS